VDWLRQVPIGQYVAEDPAEPRRGGSWLRRLDPRVKLLWTVAFLVTPVLAGPIWRLALVAALLLITLCSGLPWRLWRRSVPLLVGLALLVGVLAAMLPAGEVGASQLQRPPAEVRLLPGEPGSPPPTRAGLSWTLVKLGPLEVTRRSAELGLNSATLLFTLVHSANLLLLTTPPEDLVWALSWVLMPLARLGVPVERLGFTLLLALRFLPLVQEELQNLLRALATRAVNLKSLGWKGGLALVLALGERLLANLLLRAEQGAEALLAQGGRWLPPDRLHARPERRQLGDRRRNGAAVLGLLLLCGLRWKVGGF
jgi:energy-coupling factor transport system permease protein